MECGLFKIHARPNDEDITDTKPIASNLEVKKKTIQNQLIRFYDVEVNCLSIIIRLSVDNL